MKDRKDEGSKGIKINVKKKYFNFKSDNIIMLICMVIVGMMSGIISSEYFIDNAISGVVSSDKIDDYQALDNEEYAIRKASLSLVTISSDKAGIEFKGYKANKVTLVSRTLKTYI